MALANAGCASAFASKDFDPGVYGFGSFSTLGVASPKHFAATDQGFLDAVRAAGEKNIPCPAAQVTPQKIGALRFSAMGCGRTVRYTARSDEGNVWRLDNEVSATDGASFPNTDAGWLDATRASGAHDLQCTEPILSRVLRRSKAPNEYLADGCGQRASYASDGQQLLLTSKVRIVP